MTSKSFKVSCTLRSLKDTSVFTLLPRCVVPIIVHIRVFASTLYMRMRYRVMRSNDLRISVCRT